MEVIHAALESHACQQAYEPEIMIAVQMRNKYFVDLARFYFVRGQLYLRSFSAIDEVIFIMGLQHLRCWVSAICRQGRIIS